MKAARESLAAKEAEMAESLSKWEAEKASLNATIADLTKRDTEQQQWLEKNMLERSRSFQERYTAPIATAQEALARTLADSSTLDSDEKVDAMIAELVDADAVSLNNALSRFPAYAASTIYQQTLALRDAIDAKQAALAEWQKTRDGLEAEDRRFSEEDAARNRAALAGQAFEAVRTSGTPLYADPALASVAKSAEEEFTKAMGTLTPERFVQLAAEGFQAPIVYKMVERLHAENEQLRRRLGFASPPSAGHVPPAPPAGDSVAEQVRRFSEANPDLGTGAMIQRIISGQFAR